jgi:hypothetical protein
MERWRPQLKSVTAVVLLWQLAVALLLTGPPAASSHAGIVLSAGQAHCHTPGGAGATTAPISSNAAHTHDSDAPDCCQGMHSCSCVCAQGTVAIPQTLAATPVLNDQTGPSEIRSPPLLQRTAETFRPPI